MVISKREDLVRRQGPDEAGDVALLGRLILVPPVSWIAPIGYGALCAFDTDCRWNARLQVVIEKAGVTG